MKYYYNLYWSAEFEKNKDEIINKLESNTVQLNKYLVVLSDNPRNHLEYFDSVLLQQEILGRRELFVIGIAAGHYGAMEIVESITQEVYTETGEADIRGYLLERQREFEESKE